MATHPAGDFPPLSEQRRQRGHRSESVPAARPDSSGRSASGKPENLCPDSETNPSAADSARLKNSDRHGQAETDRSRQGRQRQTEAGETGGDRRDRQDRRGQAKTGGTPKRKRSSRPTRFLRPFCIRQAGKLVPGITRNYRSVGFRHDLWPGLAAFALLHRHDIKPPAGRPLGAENRPYVVVPLPVQLP